MTERFIDAYAVLGIRGDADAAAIKAAHRRLVRRHHPDLAPPGERARATRSMQEVNVAYALVRDPARRAEYDEVRRLHVAREAAARAGAQIAVVDDRLARQWAGLVRAAGRWAGASTARDAGRRGGLAFRIGVFVGRGLRD